jgi:hypothetical protein
MQKNSCIRTDCTQHEKNITSAASPYKKKSEKNSDTWSFFLVFIPKKQKQKEIRWFIGSQHNLMGVIWCTRIIAPALILSQLVIEYDKDILMPSAMFARFFKKYWLYVDQSIVVSFFFRTIQTKKQSLRLKIIPTWICMTTTENKLILLRREPCCIAIF